jgi:hypothetical protein
MIRFVILAVFAASAFFAAQYATHAALAPDPATVAAVEAANERDRKIREGSSTTSRHMAAERIAVQEANQAKVDGGTSALATGAGIAAAGLAFFAGWRVWPES